MVNYRLIYWILVAILTIFQAYRSYNIYSNAQGIGGGLGAFIGTLIILIPAIAFYVGYNSFSRKKK
jgi:biopolymer transport protein ExbB/TolQ